MKPSCSRKKYAVRRSESTKSERSWSNRKYLLRSLSRQRQMPLTIHSLRADFLDAYRTFRLKYFKRFSFKKLQLSLVAGGSGFKVQVHAISQFWSHHVTAIFRLHPQFCCVSALENAVPHPHMRDVQPSSLRFK